MVAEGSAGSSLKAGPIPEKSRCSKCEILHTGYGNAQEAPITQIAFDRAVEIDGILILASSQKLETDVNLRRCSRGWSCTC